ncbi:hypothetical protein CQW23_33815 [Capsicum baccatum]|uniref:Protein TAR1 n=1 Tax=Capsicum baccatum TaxID=33114 RepID=A0A2G2V0Q5_CAPBA|nr:hypothetical protein CQW23_33815 [Capsicum baccatum]
MPPRTDVVLGSSLSTYAALRWFTGFCNSHQVSHFAMFFIDARAEISVAESRFHLQKKHRSPRRTPRMGCEVQAIDSSIPLHFPRWGSLAARRARWGAPSGMGGGARAECQSTPPARTSQLLNTFATSFCCTGSTPGGALPSIPLSFSLCPSVNFFKFQPCDHTPPGGVLKATSADPRSASFMVETRTVSDRLRVPNFHS